MAGPQVVSSESNLNSFSTRGIHYSLAGKKNSLFTGGSESQRSAEVMMIDHRYEEWAGVGCTVEMRDKHAL